MRPRPPDVRVLPTIFASSLSLAITTPTIACMNLSRSEEMNRGLWEKGYREVRLTNRLSMALSPEENRYTNPFEFYRGDEILYRQPAQYNEHSLIADRAIEKGAVSWSTERY